MKHPRTLIREAVAARLIEALPKVDARITATRISIHRSTPLFAGKLPAILIYTRDERIEEGFHRLRQDINLFGSGVATGDDLDRQLQLPIAQARIGIGLILDTLVAVVDQDGWQLAGKKRGTAMDADARGGDARVNGRQLRYQTFLDCLTNQGAWVLHGRPLCAASI